MLLVASTAAHQSRDAQSNRHFNCQALPTTSGLNSVAKDIDTNQLQFLSNQHNSHTNIIVSTNGKKKKAFRWLIIFVTIKQTPPFIYWHTVTAERCTTTTAVNLTLTSTCIVQHVNVPEGTNHSTKPIFKSNYAFKLWDKWTEILLIVGRVHDSSIKSTPLFYFHYQSFYLFCCTILYSILFIYIKQCRD